MHVLSVDLINPPTPLIHHKTDIPNCGRLERSYCTWITYVHGSHMYMDRLCTWITYVHGSLMYMARACTWITYVHGSHMYMDRLCTWITYVHGSLMYMDRLCTWITYVHGSHMYIHSYTKFEILQPVLMPPYERGERGLM